jgi:hypothetical protein
MGVLNPASASATTNINSLDLFPGFGNKTITSTYSKGTNSYIVQLTGILNATQWVEYVGTGFTYSGDTPTGGTVTSVRLGTLVQTGLGQVFSPDATYTVAGSIPLTSINNAVAVSNVFAGRICSMAAAAAMF